MKYTYIYSSEAPRLILIFAGWAMDARPFAGLQRNGYDIAVVYDYRESEADLSFARGYEEVCVIAWSFGVHAADMWREQLGSAVTLRLAVAGTTLPCDDSKGIPAAIYEGTLKGLNERNLEKFYRRMCGSSENYGHFKTCHPGRPLGELAEELEIVGRRRIEPGHWDLALIPTDDAIIPPANQRRFWEEAGVPIDEIAGGHLPDFQAIIDRYIIDKGRMRSRFSKHRQSYEADAEVQIATAERLFELCEGYVGHSQDILEIGCGTGLLSRLLLSALPEDGHLDLWDIVDVCPVADRRATFSSLDAEIGITLCASNAYDLIISASTIQWFNSPQQFLTHALAALRRGGILAVSTFAAGTLAEVAQSGGVALPLLSAEQWQSVIPQGYSFIAIESVEHRLRFATPLDVFRHLKATGVNSLASTRPLRQTIKDYPLEADGSAPLTYRPLIMILQKK